MTQKVGRGGTITLDAIFTDGAGNLVDPTDPAVTIIDADAVTQATGLTPTKISVGRYELDYAVDVGAALGVWTARWSGTINSVAVQDDDAFEVVAAGAIAFAGQTLATVPELRDHVQDPDLADDDAAAAQALRIASSLIRGYTRQTLTRVEDDQETHDGRGSTIVMLAELPVEAVTAVTLDGDALTAGDDFTAAPHGVLYREGGGTWGTGRQTIVVTYTHGYDQVPDDLKGVCLDVASRVLANPEGHEREQIGAYGVGYARQRLTPDDKQILDRYRVDP